jgi:hypothetical protein
VNSVGNERRGPAPQAASVPRQAARAEPARGSRAGRQPVRPDLRCPRCGKDDRVTSLPAVHAANTATTRIRAEHVTSAGRRISTTGTATRATALGTATAPPRLPQWWQIPGVVFAATALAMVCCVSVQLPPPMGKGPDVGGLVLGALTLMLLAGTGVWTGYGLRQCRAAIPAYQQRLARWKSSFYCERCARVFLPPAPR